MVADLYGFADHRAPRVLLPGLTFDRGSGSRYSTASPASTRGGRYPPWTFRGMASHRTSSRTRWSISSARSTRPSRRRGSTHPSSPATRLSGGSASVYAGLFPTRGVVNIDAPPDPAFVHPAAITGGTDPRRRIPGRAGDDGAGFSPDLLPLPACHLIAHNSRPRQDLVVSHWDELLRQTPDQLDAMLASSSLPSRPRMSRTCSSREPSPPPASASGSATSRPG